MAAAETKVGDLDDRASDIPGDTVIIIDGHPDIGDVLNQDVAEVKVVVHKVAVLLGRKECVDELKEDGAILVDVLEVELVEGGICILEDIIQRFPLGCHGFRRR